MNSFSPYVRLLIALCLILGGVQLHGLQSATAQSQADTLLTFERTACYGPCPQYELTLFEDGALFYEGRSEVKVEGIVESQLPQCRIIELRKALRDADFFNYDRSYTSGSACSEVMMDAPTVRTKVWDGDRTHRVVHYRGCRGFPGRDILIALENEIDRILGTEQWTGVER